MRGLLPTGSAYYQSGTRPLRLLVAYYRSAGPPLPSSHVRYNLFIVHLKGSAVLTRQRYHLQRQAK